MMTLSKKEQKRLMVLNQVEVGKMIGREAAEVLDLSVPKIVTFLEREVALAR